MPTSAEEAWAPGPPRPLLADGAVHVWRADLGTVASELAELLSEDERARAARIVNEREAEMWGRSRGVLRALLGRYLQREPRSLRFVLGEHGKPKLDDTGEEASAVASASCASSPPRLSFNMSHSDRLALYAFSEAGAVGVDVEVARRAVDEVAIAARMLGAAEARRLGELDPASRRGEFLRAWARHEAALKCLGVGIGGAASEPGGRSPWVAQLEVGPEAGAAVAAARSPSELCRWDWRG